MQKKIVTFLLLGLLLSNCTLGPDFQQPAAPKTNHYTATSLPEKTEAARATTGETQRFVSGQDIPADWWILFHSEALDSLVRQALADSPSITAARATLRQAQENLKAQEGA